MAEAVCAGVGEDPYKVRTVWVAEMAHFAAKAAYARARTEAEIQIDVTIRRSSRCPASHVNIAGVQIGYELS